MRYLYCRNPARIQNDSANNYAGKGSNFETTVTTKRDSCFGRIRTGLAAVSLIYLFEELGKNPQSYIFGGMEVPLKPLGGAGGRKTLDIPPLVLQALMKWIDMLASAQYVVEVLNSTDTTIAVVWTYLLNELTPNGIIVIGPYSSIWEDLAPGNTATFSLTGCLYMKSYAVTVVYNGNPDIVLPNTSIGDINKYEKSKFGQVNICSDWWEIYSGS